jgi:hypothetical protein
MKEKNLNYMMYAYPNGELGTAELRDYLMNAGSSGTLVNNHSAEREIEELHKLFDELAPDISGMKTVAEKLRSILTEPRWVSVR